MPIGSTAFLDRINLLQRRLGDPNQKRWRYAEIVQALNFADRDFAARTRVIPAVETCTTTGNQEALTLLEVYGVRSVHLQRGAAWMDNLRASRQPWPDESLRATNTEPYLWWALRLYQPTVGTLGITTLYFGPRAVSGLDGEVHGYGLPTWQADETGSSEIPEEFAEIPLELAADRLLQRYRDWSAGREFFKNYVRLVIGAEIGAQRAIFKGT